MSRFLVFTLCCTAFANAAGQSFSPVAELTAFGSYRFGGEFDVDGADLSYELDDSPGYGLVLNLRHEPNTQWEILYVRQQTDAEFSDPSSSSVVDIDMHFLQGGGIYQGEGDVVRPFLSATVGGTYIKTTVGGGSDSDTFWSGSIGLGLKIRPSQRLGLRLEARAYGTLMSSDTDLFCRTGPNANVCAVRIDGTMLSQVETSAGVTFRF